MLGTTISLVFAFVINEYFFGSGFYTNEFLFFFLFRFFNVEMEKGKSAYFLTKKKRKNNRRLSFGLQNAQDRMFLLVFFHKIFLHQALNQYKCIKDFHFYKKM